MPYIKPVSRSMIDYDILQLSNKIKTMPVQEAVGVLNYAITSILLLSMQEESYFAYNNVLGILSAVDKEFYRRAISVYEDEKKQLNGDVYFAKR